MELWNNYIKSIKDKYPKEVAKVEQYKSEYKLWEARTLLQAIRDRDLLMKLK